MRIMTLDIGGTSIKSAFCQDGQLSAADETPTQAGMGGAHVIGRAIEIIHKYAEHTPFDRIGISTAGQVDPVRGRIIYANKNIPGYTGTEIRRTMEREFGVLTAVANDVNAAAVGEAHFGAGRGERNFACLTYGTGVGGALYLNGELYPGSSFSAGEFGALIIHPEDRHPEEDMYSGCYEKYASATALVQRAMELDPSLDNGRRIFSQIQDPAVRRIVDSWITEILFGLVTITHMINPSCLILGGGVMEQDYVLEQIRLRLPELIMPSFRHVQLRRAELGNRAGLLGAAVCAEQLAQNS